MQKGKRISYIKKPFARRSLVSLPFAVAGLLCCLVSLTLSVRLEGNGGANMAAWGFSSIVFTLIGLGYGLTSFLEKEMNYILAKIGTGISGLLLVFWLCLVIVGLVA